jgi:hypothetical protein
MQTPTPHTPDTAAPGSLVGEKVRVSYADNSGSPYVFHVKVVEIAANDQLWRDRPRRRKPLPPARARPLPADPAG